MPAKRPAAQSGAGAEVIHIEEVIVAGTLPPQDDDAPSVTEDWSVMIPFVQWRVPLPRVPDTVTLPLVHWQLTGAERESAAYYLAVGGLVAFEVIEWPVGALLAAGHVLAKQHYYRALRGAVDALESG
jgi:hypothetical protein